MTNDEDTSAQIMKSEIITFLMNDGLFIFVKNGCFTPSYRIKEIRICINAANNMQCKEIIDAPTHIEELLRDYVNRM